MEKRKGDIEMKLKEYPMILTCLVKHFEHSEIYASDQIPDEWKELDIVYKYVENNKRVLVISEKNDERI